MSKPGYKRLAILILMIFVAVNGWLISRVVFPERTIEDSLIIASEDHSQMVTDLLNEWSVSPQHDVTTELTIENLDAISRNKHLVKSKLDKTISFSRLSEGARIDLANAINTLIASELSQDAERMYEWWVERGRSIPEETVDFLASQVDVRGDFSAKELFVAFSQRRKPAKWQAILLDESSVSVFETEANSHEVYSARELTVADFAVWKHMYTSSRLFGGELQVDRAMRKHKRFNVADVRLVFRFQLDGQEVYEPQLIRFLYNPDIEKWQPLRRFRIVANQDYDADYLW